MANIKRLDGKTGVASRLPSQRAVIWPESRSGIIRPGHQSSPMTERQMEKEVQRVAFEFEREIELGFQADNRQTFAEYAKYVLELKERAGINTAPWNGMGS